ncbi:serine/threonine-protein kinase [Nitrospirillum sp. BR 11164]|uniref:serine/threonine-protein kinase n=1 Tax=Nitrospirillum sp. BR 11164 TaxID=3104324 RepID=UPI002AFEE8B2|nr:serine/threonine-protein kinase [Nitrospirillum sp. BR 11164]MEA1651334.1 serine/threonine-protein kinase [Nitrospirillum sp. BR 11164]
MTATHDWGRIEAALDHLLDLPAKEQPMALLHLAGGDAKLLAKLRQLLDQMAREETWLDRPALQGPAPLDPPGEAPPGEAAPEERHAATFASLAPGQRVGAYRIVGAIGRGGMGEVYRAERADGHFDQQVALKLIRWEAIDHVDRFQTERQILANLDHPAITRILDGGMHDGQPYMVMELVQGQSITAWCRDRGIGLDGRLTLFLAVCDAVAYAHRNLIVHRDLKPGNVLVTPQGQVKLLDFGIAKRIVTGAEANPDTLLAPLTPGYAAPEQLLGGPVSTATDAYALGMLLYELLAGARPWTLEGMPLALAVRAALQEVPPPLSQFAARSDGAPPVPVKELTGDLDAIVAKALRKEPAQRYGTVGALMRDVERMRAGLPVSARSGSRLYIAGRFVKRHRLPIAAASLLALAILGGLGGVTWQYLRAQRQATRAETIKAFVLSLYAGRDPGFPKDRQRRDVTAEKLLDLGVDRIEREFAQDPELALELYGITSDLYTALSDPERTAQMVEKRAALARTVYGESHPLVIEMMLRQAWNAIMAGDLPQANGLLDKTDALLRTSGQDKTAVRAYWLLCKAEAMHGDPGSVAIRRADVDQAVALYERYAPDHPFYPSALQSAAILHKRMGEYDGAVALYDKALARFSQSGDDVTLVYILINRANALEPAGRLEEAQRSYERAAAVALETVGQGGLYWTAQARLATLLHKRGRRAEAMALFEELARTLPREASADQMAEMAWQAYAEALSNEGRPSEAIPILERLRAIFEKRLTDESMLRLLRAQLGTAYGMAGRPGEARALLTQAAADYAKAQPGGFDFVEAEGRLGWFLLTDGDKGAAGQAFDIILALQGQVQPASPAMALAWAGRARLALGRGDMPAAAQAVEQAFAAYGPVQAAHNVRLDTSLLLTRSAVRRAAGDGAGAARDAMTALADARRSDAPDSPLIRQAQDAVAAAGGEVKQPH